MSPQWLTLARQDGSGGPLTAPECSERCGGLNMDDWHEMLQAVKARLRLSVATPGPVSGDTPIHEPSRGLQAAVFDCLAALDQLQEVLRQEGNHRLCLERDLDEMRAALAQTRVKLQGTQAGERRARHLAQHDPLTALPNRSFFRARLERTLSLDGAQRQALAVMFIDLDAFKPINDRHGHGIGDEVLRIVALRLSHAVRAEDTVSRLGGDEFACLVAGWHDRAQLSRLASKMFDAVAAPLSVGELRLTVLPSIGIAMYPRDGLGPDELLTNADAAMYRAKRGQSGFAFSEDRGPA
jgi:diguanylate cyclase (GGDEF)-like protein